MGTEVEVQVRSLEDNYHLVGTLGTGGFSVVSRGVSVKDGTEVAIKTLKKNNFRSASNALVVNEILIMNRIVDVVSPHPNVIHLIDVLEDTKSIHLVLELLRGGELFDRIVRQERYSEAGAARIIRQIACGLNDLHKAGISHRDLKPENCLFSTADEDSSLKIVDFGLSHIEGETSPIVALFGSVDYVSPETLAKMHPAPSADMWSLGVILYVLLCGYSPFHAATSKGKQELIQAGSFDFEEETWKRISDSAKQLITSLLSVDPCRRPTAAELLLHPWVTGVAANSDPVEPEVFRRLVTFNARRKFRALVYASIVSNKLMMRTKQLRRVLNGVETLSTKELDELRNQFKRISCNGVSVTLGEFEDVLRSMSMASLVPVAHRIFEHFDGDKNGSVDMREIVCGFSSLRKKGEDALKLCFQMYDADNSGSVSREEMRNMLKALPSEYLPKDIMEPGKLDELFDKTDANNDGHLSYEEFSAGVQTDKSLVDALLEPTNDKGPAEGGLG